MSMDVYIVYITISSSTYRIKHISI